VVGEGRDRGRGEWKMGDEGGAREGGGVRGDGREEIRKFSGGMIRGTQGGEGEGRLL
jgi:hypothetical protein